MIPDHLIDQAAAAIYSATVFGDEFALDAWHDMADDNPVKTTTRMYARAALEAVAADIWDEGYAAAEWNAEEVCKCAAWNEDECGCGNYGNGHRIKRNPYKEAA